MNIQLSVMPVFVVSSDQSFTTILVKFCYQSLIFTKLTIINHFSVILVLLYIERLTYTEISCIWMDI